ncbi:hypothetical protein Hsc_4598 [Herbaspirillum seropedicae]|nr:hypothetical protein Hsc_4598 [Herbaspirillum seropedicae]
MRPHSGSACASSLEKAMGKTAASLDRVMGMVYSCEHGLAVQGWLSRPHSLPVLLCARPKSSWLALCENDNLACKFQAKPSRTCTQGANPLQYWAVDNRAASRGQAERKHGAGRHRFGAPLLRQHRSCPPGRTCFRQACY